MNVHSQQLNLNKLSGTSVYQGKNFFQSTDISDEFAAVAALWISFYQTDHVIRVGRFSAGRLESKTIEVVQSETWQSYLSRVQAQEWQLDFEKLDIWIQIDEGATPFLGELPKYYLSQKKNGNILLGCNSMHVDPNELNMLRYTLSELFQNISPEKKVSSILSVSSEQQEQIFGVINNTSRNFVGLDCVESMIRNAEEKPDEIAFIFDDKQCTFGGFYQEVVDLSTALQQLTDSGDLVGVHMERGLHTVMALFAIWHAGCAWLPLSIDYKKPMLTDIARRTRPAVVLKSFSLNPSDDIEDCNYKCIEDILLEGKNNETKLTRRFVDSDEVAAVMFTSGSTGQPNAITHSFRALENRFQWFKERYPSDNDEVFVHRTALTFIPSLTEMICGMLVGRPVVIASEQASRDPHSISELVESARCTRITLLPSFLMRLLEMNSTVVEKLATLKMITIAGETLSNESLRFIRSRLPKVTIINDYGCTETNGVLFFDTTQSSIGSERLPAGRPIANCQAFVLNEDHEPVPFGVLGALYIGGICLGDGYLDNRELNDRRFITIDLPNGKKTRLFNTNDHARILPSGNIEVLGRLDNVIKLRGIRVELESVDHALDGLHYISEGATAAIKNSRGEYELAAFVKFVDEESRPSDIQIRKDLARSIPDAAIPNKIFAIQALPKTANGKLARSELVKLTETHKFNTQKQEKTSISSNVLDSIIGGIAIAMDCEKDVIDPDTNFKLLGLDSIKLVDYCRSLETKLNLEIPVSLLFEKSTPRSLANFLNGGNTQQVKKSSKHRKQIAEDVAIVGMACRMPGANNVSEFWQLIKAGKSMVGEVPRNRFDWRKYYTDRQPKINQIVSKWGAFIDDIDGFDPEFFNISEREALYMSPEQRLWLMTSWQALADAGLTETRVSGRPVGVFAGARTSDYSSRLRENNEPISSMTLLGSDNAILASRISYFLNLKGPSITYDTACSSSLLSVIEACKSISNGECEIAIAGGVSAVTAVDQYLANSRAGMLSPNGRCATFDANADGFVQGEGVAAIVLKPLSNAIADGDVIYSVIKGYAVNQDGKTNGITAPNGESQRALLYEAYENAGISPEQVGLIEAHGTGTKLGDPIEFSALSDFFSRENVPSSNCALGSVKTNIGHLIGASGIAGLMKAALSVYHAHIPATLNFNKINEHIPIEKSPFYIPKVGSDWYNLKSRIAGVSAFGFSGTNCHLILSNFEFENAQTLDGSKSKRETYFIPLSGRSEGGLKIYAKELRNFLESSEIGIEEFSYRMAKRFNSFEWRALIIGRSLQDIRDALSAIVGQQSHPTLLFFGRVTNDLGSGFFAKIAAELADSISNQDGVHEGDIHEAVATFFKNDVSIDFGKLNGDSSVVTRSHIPTYPFERHSYWIENVNPNEEEFIDFEKKDYSDHRINGEVWVPLSGLILAIADNLGRRDHFSIKRISVLRPIKLTEPRVTFDFIKTQVDSEHYVLAQDNKRYVSLLLNSKRNIDKKICPREIASTFSNTVKGSDFYQKARDKGLEFGVGHRFVDRIFYSQDRAMSFVRCSDDNDKHQAGLLDSAFQTTLALLPESGLFVPIGLSDFDLLGPIPSQFFCLVQKKNFENAGEEIESFFVSLCDPDGNVFALIDDFQLIKFKQNKKAEMKESCKPVSLCGSGDCFDSFAFGVWVPEEYLLPLANGSESEESKVGIFPGLLPELEEGIETVNYGETDNLETIPERWLWKPSGTDLTGLLSEFVMYVNWLLKNVECPELVVLHSGESLEIAALSGAAYAAQHEYPEFSFKVVQTEPDRVLDRHFFESGKLVEFQIGKDAIASRRWVQPDNSAAIVRSEDERAQPVCVITGGTGNVGRELSNWLIANKNARLAIVGRRPLNKSEQDHIISMQSRGAEVAYLHGDLSSVNECKKIISKIERRFNTIDRVYHCAGVTRDSLIINKKMSEIEEVVKAKVSTIQSFDEALGSRPIELIAVFSSVSAIVGTSGQCDYGAANSWLDKYVIRRNLDPKKHGHAISVNWALWDGPGMDPGDRRRAHLKDAIGMLAMPPAEAIELLDQLCDKKVEQAVVAYGVPEKLENWLNKIN